MTKLNCIAHLIFCPFSPLLHLPVEKLRIDCLRRKLKRAVIVTSPYTRKKRRTQETRCITVSWHMSTMSDKLSDVLQINYDPGGPLKSVSYINWKAKQILIVL